MSRKRKFTNGDICYWLKPVAGLDGVSAMPYYGVIVDYKQDGKGRGMYRVVRVLHPSNGAPFGEAVWVDTHFLLPVPEHPKRKTIASRYRANQMLVERGCECNCCAHEAIPLSIINSDGTFKHE